jgi:3'(2'), 5'-bisphosphate nucleotidase
MISIAIAAALEAGNEIMRIYDDPSQDFGIERKADNSPLTLADKAAHNCIVRHLEPTGIPILSEEGAHLPYEERKAWHRLWIVDPLDGTKEFIKKNGEFTVNIALVEDGKPVLGVIYVPATGVLYAGVVGEGAWKTPQPPLGGEQSSITIKLPLKGGGGSSFVIVASRSHLTPETEEYIEEMRRMHGEVQLISSGSSLKLCLVAEGTADVYPRFAPTMEWDTAAGDAIARAAGKVVVDAKNGQPLTYNKPDLHNPWFIVTGTNNFQQR